MSFVRPTLSELKTRIRADLVSRLTLATALLRRAFVFVLSHVLAGAAHELHGHLDFLAKQLFPDTSDDEYFKRQAALFGVTQVPPSFASVFVAFAGAGTVPAGTVLTNAAGTEYTLDADTTLPANGHVTCSVPGSIGALPVGAVLTLQSPIVGVNSQVTVVSIDVDGVDEEKVDSTRQRLVERLAVPPHGGNDADYIAWAKSVPGVTRVWVRAGQLGPGTVVVYFVRDDDPSRIPDAGEVAAVQAVIDAKRPVHVTPTAFAPVDAVLNITLHVEPNTLAMKAAVEANLRDLDTSADLGASTLLSTLLTTIGATEGLTDYTLISPVANTPHAVNALLKIGTVTFT